MLLLRKPFEAAHGAPQAVWSCLARAPSQRGSFFYVGQCLTSVRLSTATLEAGRVLGFIILTLEMRKLKPRDETRLAKGTQTISGELELEFGF